MDGPRAYSSVGLERTPDKREVSGSNPLRPTNLQAGAVAQLGERRVCNAEVAGSIPASSTNREELQCA